MNNLDNKVIVDREVLYKLLMYLYENWAEYSMTNEGPIARKAEQALATDLTGWVAVQMPQKQLPPELFDAATEFYKRMGGYYHDKHEVNRAASMILTAMLEASPPLPQEGE